MKWTAEENIVSQLLTAGRSIRKFTIRVQGHPLSTTKKEEGIIARRIAAMLNHEDGEE